MELRDMLEKVKAGEVSVEEAEKYFVKKPFEGMEKERKEEIISDAVSRLRDRLYQDGTWIVDYVRIQFRAVK